MKAITLVVELIVALISPFTYAVAENLPDQTSAELSTQPVQTADATDRHAATIDLAAYCRFANSITTVADAAKQARGLSSMRTQGLISPVEFILMKQWLVSGCTAFSTAMLHQSGGTDSNSVRLPPVISTRSVTASELTNPDDSKYRSGYSWHPETAQAGSSVSTSASVSGATGCGSRGGPGWRKANGECASWTDGASSGFRWKLP